MPESGKLPAANAASDRAPGMETEASPPSTPAVYRRMGYIVALVLIAIVVPLLFVLLSRRSSSAGGLSAGTRDRGVTVSKPSADAPTPRADAINQLSPEAEKRLPPG